MKWLLGILGGIIALINLLMAFFWKGLKRGEEIEQYKNKSAAYDQMVKIQNDINKHRDDSMDNVRDRMSKYARTK